jgi:hypothetical protein
MAKKPVPSLASVPVTAPAEMSTMTLPTEKPPVLPAGIKPSMQARESLHVRIPSELVERVREAAHRLRRDKQDIAAEALHEWLAARGM